MAKSFSRLQQNSKLNMSVVTLEFHKSAGLALVPLEKVCFTSGRLKYSSPSFLLELRLCYSKPPPSWGFWSISKKKERWKEAGDRSIAAVRPTKKVLPQEFPIILDKACFSFLGEHFKVLAKSC